MRLALPLLASALALTFSLAPSAARAQVSDDARKRADESFRQAQDAFERKQFAAAAAAFEQAAFFAPHPAPLLNAEEAWEKAGEPARAAEDCDRVLAMGDVDAKFRDEAQRRIQSLTQRVATLDLQGPRTFVVRIDGGPTIELPARRRVAPGHHTLSIADLASSRTHSLEIDLARGDLRAINAAAPALTPAPAPAPNLTQSGGFAPPARRSEGGAAGADPTGELRSPLSPPRALAPSPDASRSPARAPAWIALGSAAAATGVAITFGALTLSSQSDYNATPTPATRDAFHRNKSITNVAWAIAGVAAISGSLLVLRGRF